MMGTDLEKIEGNEIHVEIFPNRPDLLSEQGFARAFSSFIGVKTGLRKYNVKKSGYKLIVDESVKSIRPYTACAIVKNLKFDDEKIKEIIQIQEKLHITFGRNRKKAAIGIYPMEAIKFPIKFIGKDPKKIKFRPLEFPKEITGLQILSQHPAGRDYGHLLEGMKKFPIFIDAEDQILSMPPIINGHSTGRITEKTKDIFIECSGFDFEVLKKCLNMIVTALDDMGGDIYNLDLIYKNKNKTKKYISPDLSPEKMRLQVNYVNKITGLNLNNSKIKKLLEKMGFGIEKSNQNELMVLIPCYRTDILHPIDFIEDIAIAYGYENFKEDIPKVATIGEENKFEVFKDKIADILVSLGLLETKNYYLIGKNEQTTLMNCDIKPIEVLNPVAIEYNSLRNWIIPSVLQTLKNNRQHEYPQNIFDIGTIFKKDKSGKSETKVIENDRVGVAICDEKSDFTRARQMLDGLFKAMNIEYKINETEHPSFIPGRVGRVSVQGKIKGKQIEKDVAYIGEINPQVLSNFNLEMPVAAFELNLTELFEVIKE